NRSALVPWERRVWPALYVKNSGEVGATASSCCWGAGLRDSRAPGRSEFKRCWKGQGACRTYCTRQETYMHLCPDGSLCCLPYGLKAPAAPKPESV
uniref:Beta-defensin n=1 Tax=Equus caballus TaxID=9796 RepID=A0A9L0T3T1_HORSE